jgi:hypothetical protein
LSLEASRKTTVMITSGTTTERINVTVFFMWMNLYWF